MKRSREETLVMQPKTKRAHSVADIQDEVIFEHDGIACVNGETWFAQRRVARMIEEVRASERRKHEEEKEAMRLEYQAHIDAVQHVFRDQVARADAAVAHYSDLYIN